MTFFSAYQVIHTWYEQNETLKRSLKFFCGNEDFKHVIDVKFDMKLSDYAREKITFQAKEISDPIFLLKLCVRFSRKAVML